MIKAKLRSKKVSTTALRNMRRRRKTTNKVTTTAQVARIARKVTLRAAETKSPIFGIDSSLVDGAVRVWNLIYNISGGSTSETVIGEKLYLKNIHLKGALTSNTNSNAYPKQVRLIVFRSKKNLATSSGIDITRTDLFRISTDLPSMSHVDMHKVDLLADYTMQLVIPFANGRALQFFDVNVPINKTHYFDQDNSGFLKDKNYYLALQAYDGNGIVSPCAVNCQYTVNFKDE